MTVPDTSSWTYVGDAGNSRYYTVAEGILAAVPREGAVDDRATAQANADFQNDYFRQRRPGVVVIFFDPMSSQDKDARRVYQSVPDPALLLASALVGGSLLSRAMGAFFLGLSKPKIPVKVFASLDDALPWLRKILVAHVSEKAP